MTKSPYNRAFLIQKNEADLQISLAHKIKEEKLKSQKAIQLLLDYYYTISLYFTQRNSN